MYGLLIAFKDYSPVAGVLGSPWIGFAHFQRLFTDPDFYMILRNTIVFSLLHILIFPAPIIMALMLNDVRSSIYRKSIQTVVYMPHFLSWVVVFSLTYLLMSSEQGLINKFVVQFGGKPIAFLFSTQWFYPIIVFQDVWKNVGWGSIIYLAAIAGIDPSLYEAAVIDGARKIQQIWYVTIPALMPTIIVLFILGLGSILDTDFEHLYLMQNPMVNHIAEVIDTYVYKQGVQGGQYSYTTAVGMFKSVISLFLVLVSNHYAEKFGYEGIL